MTCIFRDKDTARFLMGTAVQTGGKQLGVHNISTVSNGGQIIKKKKKNTPKLQSISVRLENM